MRVHNNRYIDRSPIIVIMYQAVVMMHAWVENLQQVENPLGQQKPRRSTSSLPWTEIIQFKFSLVIKFYQTKSCIVI